MPQEQDEKKSPRDAVTLISFCLLLLLFSFTQAPALNSFADYYRDMAGESKAMDSTDESNDLSYSTSEDEDEEYRLTIVVPGLGDEDRIPTLNRSLNLIMASDTTKTSCIVYVYNQTLLDKHRDDLPQCDLVYNEGFWTKHMQRAPVHPVVDGENATHVALLMDDIALGANTSVDDILQVMKEANYQAASPAFPDWFHDIMRPRETCRTHLSNYIDVLFVVMTIDAWKCWKANVDRYIQFKYGWGLDIIFADSCNISSGIIDDIPATHKACWKCDRSYGTKEARAGMFELLMSHLGNKTTWKQAKQYKTSVHKMRHTQYPHCHLHGRHVNGTYSTD